MKRSTRTKTPASDAVRRRKRDELRNLLDHFMEEASAAEVWLMIDALLHWESCKGLSEDQVVLAESFSDALRRNIPTYLKIDDGKKSRAVFRFMDEYERSGGKFTPAQDGWLYWRGDEQKTA